MDKTTLLNTIQTDYAPLESLVASIPDAQLSAVPAEGEWSIKDIMAHVAAWEQICARWLAAWARGETLNPSERIEGGVNDRLYRENRDRSLAEVQALCHQAHQQLVQQVELLLHTFSEEDITAPRRFTWTQYWPGSSVLAVIADNSYEHYQDHAQQIRRLLDTTR